MRKFKRSIFASSVTVGFSVILFMGCLPVAGELTGSDLESVIADHPEEKTSGCGLVQSSGTFTRSIVVNGETRVYKIIVPNGYDPDFAYRAIVSFHGSAYSNTADTMISQTTSLRGAANNRAIFIYPDERINGVPLPWNTNATGKDFQFFDELLDEVSSQYCIDSSRVFVVGFSNGAGMANALGCHRQDRVRGIADTSGYLPNKNSCPTKGVAAYLWHGQADTITSFTKYAVPQFNYWKSANGCSGGTVAALPASESCVRYLGCTNAPLTICSPSAAGHGYPSSLGGPIWDFFELL